MDLIPFLGLAFFSGIITSFQPCLFPLLPTYFSYMNSYKKGKISIQEGVTVSFFLTLGILVVFLLLALLAKIGISGLSTLLLTHVPEFNMIMSILLIIVGLLMIFGKELTFFYRFPGLATFLVSENPENNMIASFSLGLAYTAIAAPCAAPIFLNLVFTFIILDPLSITLLMIIYAMGCGIPFLVIGLLYPNFGKEIRKNYLSLAEYIKPVSGVILLLMSFYLINDYVLPYYNIQIGDFVFGGFDKGLMSTIYITFFVIGLLIIFVGFIILKSKNKQQILDDKPVEV